MLVCLPFFAGDKHLAENLARWIVELGGVSKHDCLLIVDKSTTSAGVIEPLRGAFASVMETSSEPVGDQGTWGKGTTNAEGPNEMFLTSMVYVQNLALTFKQPRPWFWLETDAVPMRPTWLDEIEAEYKRGQKPFMGAYVDIAPHEPHMSGIAVYPPEVPRYSLDMSIPRTIAWDYAGRKDTVGKGKAHFTSLIQHEYRIHGESPTFPTQDSLAVIKPETAVFHRCKDASLLARLRERRIVAVAGSRISTDSASPVEPSLAATILHSQVDSYRNMVTKLEAELAQKENQISELTAKLNALRIAPAVEACKPGKRKGPMSEATKAKIRAAHAERKKAMTGVK